MKKTITQKEPLEKEPEPKAEKDYIYSKEEIDFLQYYVGGYTRREAYKKAFPKRAHWSISSLDPEISKLLATPRITQLLTSLQEDYIKQNFMTKEYKRSELKSIWEDTSLPLKDRLKAIELDMKMGGDVAPTKVENSGTMNLTHSVAPEISDALDKMFK